VGRRYALARHRHQQDGQGRGEPTPEVDVTREATAAHVLHD
jgi:hypothetical protein